jgi:DNA segregation ATPase FtsK/SpoIIIE, S-DNA-T family
MSQVQEPLKAANKRSSQHNSPPDPQVEDQKGDFLVDFWLRFGRFGWDIAGVALIAFALMTLIGFLTRGMDQEAVQGFFISPWVSLVSKTLGFGWPLAVFAIALLGLLCLRRRFAYWPRIPLGRVLALEGLAFCFLAFLSILGGWSLNNAEAGLDGGIVGWGLAILLDRFLPVPWGTIFIIALMLAFAFYGSGLAQWSLRKLESWLDTVAPVTPSPPAAVPQPAAAADDEEPAAPWLLNQPQVRDPSLPPLTLLLPENSIRPDESYIQDTARQIEHTLAEFGVPARVVGYRIGPTITQYAVEPGFVEKTGPDGEMIRQKVRVSQISALARDLALSLSAERLRIEAPVPGRTYMGIEVPNPTNTVVRLRPLLESDGFFKLSSPLSVALGRDVSGQPLLADLARMPHLLIAGTTGSGKSVCIATIAACLVMNNHPSDLRMAMLDPKMVELVRFNGLPHLFGRVETEVERMLGVLRWALMEMDHRYRLLEDARTRDIDTYNRRAAKRSQPTLPRIVIIIDELADLMMTAPDQTEHSLIRLAQMARATGIHLVVATQRPSTDVVTGLIKANFPARLAFSVASSIDSRVILDTSGAESLLGKGDMLFLNPEAGTPARAQGVWVTDEEVEAVTTFWKNKTAAAPQTSEAAPWEELIQNEEEENADGLVEQAVKIVRATQRASTSLLQRRLRIGYPRAARLMDELEELGVVGPSMGGGREREVFVDKDEDISFDEKDQYGGDNEDNSY